MAPISDRHAQQNAQSKFAAERDAIERAADRTEDKERDARNVKPGIDNERREELIAVAAYFRAERRQFRDGSPEDDWLQAEAEIDRQLTAGNP